MNYAWARDRTLELIDQYSVGGRAVPASYNNQADYLKKIPGLLDQAAVVAATGACRLRAVTNLAALEREQGGPADLYTLPDDFWQLAGGGLLRVSPRGMDRVSVHRLVDGRRLALPRGCPQDMLVEYFRWPRLLGDDPADDAELDNTVAAQMALPLFAAAHLAILDSPYVYAALLNEFNGRLGELAEPAQAERSAVEDVYQSGEE